MSWQQLIIVGNVGNVKEIKYTQAGHAILEFSLAVNERWGDGTEHAMWFRVSVWNKLAEPMTKFIHKGKMVMVVGTVSGSAYLDKNNQPAYSLEVRARDVRLLGGRGDGEAVGGDDGNRNDDNVEIPF